MKLLLIALPLLFQTGLLAEQYSSKALKTKDYEEMRDLLNKYIKNSQSNLSDDEEVDGAVSELKKGLKILLMKPDTAVATKTSLLLILQNEIIKYRSFMNVLQEVIEEALSELKSKKGSLSYQVSLLYLIENSLSHLQSIKNKESNAILRKIMQADLKISKKMFNYLLLEMGRGKTASPSFIAGKILKSRLKELQEEKAKKARQEKIAKKKKKPSNVKVKNQKKDTPKMDSQIDL